MPRPIEHRAGFGHPAARVFEALTDEDFLRARLAELGGKKSELASFSSEGDTTRYTLRQTVDAGDLPSVARKVARGDLVIERSETWTASRDRYTGDIQAHVLGTPGSAHGTMQLSDSSDGGSALVFGGSVKVGVPLVGGKLEDMIVDQLGRLLRAEAKFTQRWLESAS